MRLVLLSDTHGLHGCITVPDGDILIHSGDYMNSGRHVSEFYSFRNWWLEQPHKVKIFISGNHDILAQKDPSLLRSLHSPKSGLYYLCDSETVIDGIKFYGSPWTPTFFVWAFMKDRGEDIRKVWDLIPSDTDVLITHGPPIGILDQAAPKKNSDSLGCADLRMKVDSMPNLKVHCFGHIHGGVGQKKIGNTLFINASQVDERYRPVNKPIVVDL